MKKLPLLVAFLCYLSLKIFEYPQLLILQNLYDNNYALLDIESVYSTHEITTHKSFLFPVNKKPLLMFFQNVTYRSSFKNTGEIDKIIIDRNNNLASYSTKQSIQDRIHYDNEFILILENFISIHPDFSFNSARGVICFSGDNGLLGYNTSHKNVSYKYETKRVSQVIRRLQSMGWKFGCNNYSYVDNSNLSDIQFAKDLSLWKNEVEPIIDITNIYSFPYGNKNITLEKQNLLFENNFEIFIYKDNSNCELLFEDNCLFISTREITGQTLSNNREDFLHLFDCNKIIDKNFRK